MWSCDASSISLPLCEIGSFLRMSFHLLMHSGPDSSFIVRLQPEASVTAISQKLLYVSRMPPWRAHHPLCFSCGCFAGGRRGECWSLQGGRGRDGRGPVEGRSEAGLHQRCCELRN